LVNQKPNDIRSRDEFVQERELLWRDIHPKKLAPVTFPAGRLRLGTMPALTGSPPLIKTIGIVVVALLAASAAASV
jgi:hypothetical protein